MSVPVHVAPEGRHAVQVAAAARVDQPAAFPTCDDERRLGEPVRHLGERMPEMTMIPVCERLRIGHGVAPVVRAAATNASRARSSCASVCVAMGVTRSLAVPGGTVG